MSRTIDMRRRRVAPTFRAAPPGWKQQCTHVECSLHQLSPYIGKLKSPIARHLIERYSRPGELVFDPFSGSGTIPLEAALAGRNVLALDISPYATLLTAAKLRPPKDLSSALLQAECALHEASRAVAPDLRTVPVWVRSFFHPRTLKEALQFANACRGQLGREFLFACFLGILHHQRPGFLSYPSSHLVPYLRSKKYPRRTYPEMYEYRELRSRLLRKIERAYKRFEPGIMKSTLEVHCNAVDNFRTDLTIDSIITSPPYMNALDYTRDNRLRLWFQNPGLCLAQSRPSEQRSGFERCIRSVMEIAKRKLRSGGYCVFVVGEQVTRYSRVHPSQALAEIMTEDSTLKLRGGIYDFIPDVRRSRRNCHGTRREHILVYQKP